MEDTKNDVAAYHRHLWHSRLAVMIFCSIWEAVQLSCQEEHSLETHDHASSQCLFRKRLWCRSCCRPQHAYLTDVGLTRVCFILNMPSVLSEPPLLLSSWTPISHAQSCFQAYPLDICVASAAAALPEGLSSRLEASTSACGMVYSFFLL